MKEFTLEDFVAESNRIEGIHRKPTPEELEATQDFLALRVLTIPALEDLVHVYARAILRDRLGLDVQIGAYRPMRGGQGVRKELQKILDKINESEITSYQAHLLYETLHPFTDGNGRSGRAIWLWQHAGFAPIGFLHAFYYQTLRSRSV